MKRRSHHVLHRYLGIWPNWRVVKFAIILKHNWNCGGNEEVCFRRFNKSKQVALQQWSRPITREIPRGKSVRFCCTTWTSWNMDWKTNPWNYWNALCIICISNNISYYSPSDQFYLLSLLLWKFACTFMTIETNQIIQW